MRHGQDRDSLGDEEDDDITDCGDGVTVQYSTVQYSTVHSTVQCYAGDTGAGP